MHSCLLVSWEGRRLLMANVAISIGVRVVLDDIILNLHLLYLFGLGPLDVEYHVPSDTEYLAHP